MVQDFPLNPNSNPIRISRKRADGIGEHRRVHCFADEGGMCQFVKMVLLLGGSGSKIRPLILREAKSQIMDMV